MSATECEIECASARAAERAAERAAGAVKGRLAGYSMSSCLTTRTEKRRLRVVSLTRGRWLSPKYSQANTTACTPDETMKDDGPRRVGAGSLKIEVREELIGNWVPNWSN
jgi:hypothetical protein